jgi:hypothetical protein
VKGVNVTKTRLVLLALIACLIAFCAVGEIDVPTDPPGGSIESWFDGR